MVAFMVSPFIALPLQAVQDQRAGKAALGQDSAPDSNGIIH